MIERGRKLHIGLECGEPFASFPPGRTLGLSLKEHMAKAQGTHGDCSLQERGTCGLLEMILYSFVKGFNSGMCRRITLGERLWCPPILD